jgi:hypothetical protein
MLQILVVDYINLIFKHFFRFVLGRRGSQADPSAHPALGEARHDDDRHLPGVGVHRKKAHQRKWTSSRTGKMTSIFLS